MMDEKDQAIFLACVDQMEMDLIDILRKMPADALFILSRELSNGHQPNLPIDKALGFYGYCKIVSEIQNRS